MIMIYHINIPKNMNFFDDSIISFPSILSTSSTIIRSIPSTQPNLSFAISKPVLVQKDASIYDELMGKQIAVLYTNKSSLTSVLY